MHISDTSRATASDQLTVTDVMAALGMTQSDAGIGLAMYLGKAGISSQDREASIIWLAEYAKERAPMAVRKASGKNSHYVCAFLPGLHITITHHQQLIAWNVQNAVVKDCSQPLKR